MTTIIWAAQNGRLTCLQMLIQANTSLEVKEVDSWTPLMFAARNGNSACNEASMNAKADLTATDD